MLTFPVYGDSWDKIQSILSFKQTLNIFPEPLHTNTNILYYIKGREQLNKVAESFRSD